MCVWVFEEEVRGFGFCEFLLLSLLLSKNVCQLLRLLGGFFDFGEEEENREGCLYVSGGWGRE